MEEILQLQAEVVEDDVFSCNLLTTSSRGSICA